MTKRLALSIESRGRHATGYAFRGVGEFDGQVLLHKLPLTARAFINQGHLRSIQRHTNTALIHTRHATTGDPKDNDNNHPVVVQRRDHHPGIVGVHNGMLWNHTDIWRSNEDLAQEAVGEVDSQVIFQLLSRRGRDSLDLLDGDASIAWLDLDQPDELNIARMGGRPLAAVTTSGGSLIFASTGEALLDALGYFHGAIGKVSKGDICDLQEGDWLTVANGEVLASGGDFPVISLAKSYGYSRGTTTRLPATSPPYQSTHQSTWDLDPWDDDAWNTPRHEQQVTETAGGALLPFAMSPADKRTWELSMEEAVRDEDGGDDSSTDSPAADTINLPEFDRDFFHFLTRGVFLGTAIDPRVMEALVELAYHDADEDRLNELLNGFCEPTSEYDKLLADDIAHVHLQKGMTHAQLTPAL